MREQDLAATLNRIYADIEDHVTLLKWDLSIAVKVDRAEMNKRFSRLIHFKARSEGQKRRWGK